MIKRLRWMLLGAAATVGAYVWLKGKTKERVPSGGSDALRAARDTARDLGARLREAIREGRETAEGTREQLERELLPPRR